MKVIVDTSVWSLAFRRPESSAHSQVTILRELIEDGRVMLLGAVRQEILSGIRHREQFDKLKVYFRAFPDPTPEVEDYELAADYFTICRKQGIQGANTDFLICAVANRRQYEILTTDKDFDAFSRHLPIKLAQN